MPLINCEASLTLAWSKNCVFTDMATRIVEGGNPAIAAATNSTFKIKDSKLYVSVVT